MALGMSLNLFFGEVSGGVKVLTVFSLCADVNLTH